jgi:nucleoside phosphorylase
MPMNEFLVAATGLGKVKATLATERLLQAHDLRALVHVGTCVGLDEQCSVGTVVGASFVLEGDRVELEAPTYPRMPLECPFDVDVEGTLVSQDHTSSDEDERTYWERLADVRDNTGYPVAFVAAQHGTPCHVVKAVSSHVDDSNGENRQDALRALTSVLDRATDDGPLTTA